MTHSAECTASPVPQVGHLALTGAAARAAGVTFGPADMSLPAAWLRMTLFSAGFVADGQQRPVPTGTGRQGTAEQGTARPSTTERFFKDDAQGYAIYQAVERMARTVGPLEVRVSKSQVAFRRRRGFAYLWRPGMYVKSSVPLVLSLPLPRNAPSPRFKQIVQPSPGIWMHHLELRDSSDLDAEVFGWLREAYEAAA